MFQHIEKHIRKRVDDVVFIELKNEKALKLKDFVFDSNVPLPVLLKDFVSKVKGQDEKDIPITSIVSGAIYILGIDPDFKYKDHYIELLKAFHENPLHYILGMGFTEIQNGEYMNALICFRGALALDPESLDALYNIGRCCEDIAERNDGKRLEQDFTKSALLIFERIIELFPDSHLGYYHVGFHYANLKQYAQAEAMWHEAIKKDIDENKQLELVEKIIELQDKVIYEEGYQLVLNGRYQEGLEKLLSIEDKYQDWWNLLFFIGLAYRGLEQFDEAVKYYQKVLVHHPKHPETHNELGLTYMVMGLTTDAEEAFVEGIRIKPDSHEMLCNLSIIHMEKGQLEIAEKFLEQANEIAPEDEITQTCIRHLNQLKQM